MEERLKFKTLVAGLDFNRVFNADTDGLAAPNENIHNFLHIVSSWRAQIAFQRIAEIVVGTKERLHLVIRLTAPAKEGQQLELTPGCKSAASVVGMWG